ncbi:MAG: FAD-binding oxidoreductase [Ectothiorhodospiraceae bacterium]|nr:FAD-binding oxidoreductase [Ectothiorhodospiraceae bacterium]
MPAPLLTIESTPDLPASADAVVIGGGIIGCSTAWFLARAGLRVALLEKGRVGAEQSSRNWGWCRQMNRDARELPLATRSLELWEAMQAELGSSLGFSRCGLLYLSDDDAEIDRWARWCAFAAGEGVRTEVLGPSAAAERGRATAKPWRGGVVSPTDGIADPARAVPVIARGLTTLGATVHQFCAARGIERSGGRISAVMTEAGRIATTRVVMAGGAWASSFCRQLGVSFPQASVRSTVLSVQPGADGLPDALHTAGVSVTRRGDGGYTLAISGLARVDPTLQHLRYARHFLPMLLDRHGLVRPGGLHGLRAGHESWRRWRLDAPTPMERTRVLDPIPDRATVDLTLDRARRLLPALGTVPVQAAWAGYIDSTPDGVPVIDEVLPGLVLAAGFSGHGFGIGPGAGQLIAQMVLGATPDLPFAQYALSRFRGLRRADVSGF